MLFLSENHRRQEFFVVLGLLTITAFALSPVLFNGFATHDDPGHVLENPDVLNLKWRSLGTIFSSTVCQTYIPLTVLTFAIEQALFGFNPFVYHLNNLLLHLGVVWLIYHFARRWLHFSVLSAGFAALLFGIHPMHVESVAWVTERKDVLYSFLYLLALHQYCHYLHTQKNKHFLLTVLFGLLSALSKAMALSLPLVLLLIDWYFQKPWSRKNIFQKVLLMVVMFPAIWMTYSHHARIPQMDIGSNLLSWLWCLNFYPIKFFWPEPLVPVYSCPQPVTIWNPHFYAAVFSLGVMVWLMILYHRDRLLKFAVFYYFLSIFFLLRFDNLVDVNFVADRFMYLPSLGICLWLGHWLTKIIENAGPQSRQFTVMVGLVGLVFFACGVKTFCQAKLWGDGVAFWTHELKYYPRSFIAYDHRGFILSQRGEMQAAIEDYNHALRINPVYQAAFNNRGILYGQLQKYELAFQDFAQAIKLNPRDERIYFNQGRVYEYMQNWQQAIENYSQVLAINPRHQEALNNRGAVYLRQQKYHLALQDLNQALNINAQNIFALNNRAIILAAKGDYQEALADFNASLKINPKDAQTYYNRGILFMRAKKIAAAIADFDRTLQLDPYHENALKNKLKLEQRL